MRYSIVILNFKTYRRTIKLLENINSFIGDFNVFVVDNSCNRERFIQFRKEIKGLELPEIHILYSHENGGYARGNNIALHYADANNLLADYVIILNNDIEILDKRFLLKLSEKIRQYPAHNAFGPRVVHKSTGYLQGPYKRKQIFYFFLEAAFPVIGFARKKLNRILTPGSDSFVYRVMGCALIIESKEFKSVGFFDPNTFLGAEEDILGEKLMKKGKGFVYLPELLVYHDHGLSTNELNNRAVQKYFRDSIMYYFRVYRNSRRINLLILRYSLRIIDFWKSGYSIFER